ncbi:TonB-dependent receptor, partial [human gut metagenome]
FSFFIDRETEDLDMNTKKGSALTQSVDKNTTTTSTGLRWNSRRGRSSLMVQSYYNHYKDTYDQYKRTGGIKKLSIWDEYYNKEWITDAQVNTAIDKKEN